MQAQPKGIPDLLYRHPVEDVIREFPELNVSMNLKLLNNFVNLYVDDLTKLRQIQVHISGELKSIESIRKIKNIAQ